MSAARTAREPDADGARRRHRLAIATSVAVIGALIALAIGKLDLTGVGHALSRVQAGWVILALALMGSSFMARAESWHAAIRAALPAVRSDRALIRRAILIGMVGSAVAPGRAGEAARTWIVARRLGNASEVLGVVIGTVLAQVLLNALALAMLTAVALSGGRLSGVRAGALALAAALPVVVAAGLLAGPRALRRAAESRSRRLAASGRWMLGQLLLIRRGLRAFRQTRASAHAGGSQLCAWGLQLATCYVTFIALGDARRASAAAAAAVLVAVNVSAIVPLTPSNVGVFQAACIAVLAPFGFAAAHSLAYGLVLQAVEVACALGLGIPALLREGVTWSEVRRATLIARGP